MTIFNFPIQNNKFKSYEIYLLKITIGEQLLLNYFLITPIYKILGCFLTLGSIFSTHTQVNSSRIKNTF